MQPYIIALDFDGTVVEHEYPKIGPLVPGAIKWLKKLQDAGAEFVLNTCRTDEELIAAINFLKANGIKRVREPDAPNKPFACIYIDDRGVGVPLIPGKNRPMVNWEAIGQDVLSRVLANKETAWTNQKLHVTTNEFSGSWVFSDLNTGLVDEPFVNGADDVFEYLTQDYRNSAILNGVIAEFSDKPFPGSIHLIRDEEENKLGNWYTVQNYMTGHRAWLCPALYAYFQTAPTNLYIQIHEVKN